MVGLGAGVVVVEVVGGGGKVRGWRGRLGREVVVGRCWGGRVVGAGTGSGAST